MLSEKKKNLRLDSSQEILKNINEYSIKIDYFDQKGTKNFENNIPLKCIFNIDVNLTKMNLKVEY